MQRIIVIVVLSVLTVVESGCDKIKTELERRHLGSASQKETTHSTSQTQKTLPIKLNDGEGTSGKKQIVFRIDLPADEKIQIRLINNATPEEMSKNAAADSPKETLKAAQPSPEAQDAPSDKPNRSAESAEKKPVRELNVQKDEESKSEIKTETEKESHSETKTDQDETFPPPPVPAPSVVVPAREMNSLPPAPEKQVKNASASEQPSEPAPAEKAVGLALSVTPPEINALPSNKTQNSAPATNKPTLSNPWAIPNADYPLGYYE